LNICAHKPLGQICKLKSFGSPRSSQCPEKETLDK